MQELILKIREEVNRKAKYTFWMPRGGVVVAITDHRRKCNWAEIICSFPRPSRRKDYDEKYHIPGWDKIKQAWTEDLLAAWLASEPSILADEPECDRFWSYFIAPLGLLADMPNAPESDLKVHDTFLWGKKDLKDLFVVATDSDVAENTGLDGVNPDIPMEPRIVRPRLMFDFDADPEISEITTAWLDDPDITVYPRHDKSVDEDKFEAPDISGLV